MELLRDNFFDNLPDADLVDDFFDSLPDATDIESQETQDLVPCKLISPERTGKLFNLPVDNFFDSLPDATDIDLLETQVYKLTSPETNGRFVGYFGDEAVSSAIHVSGNLGDEVVFLRSFYIKPNQRRKGHGTQLLRLLMQRYNEAGTREMAVVNPTSGGLKFYKKMGFKRKPWGDYHVELTDTSQHETLIDEVSPQELANSLVKMTKPRTSANPKTIQATKLRAQKKLVQAALEGGSNQDELTAAAVKFKVGQKVFPKLAAMTRVVDELTLLKERVSSAIAATGRHSRSSVIKELTGGLPKTFCLEQLGLTEAEMKRSREARTNQASDDSFMTKNYSSGVKRSKITELESSMLKKFFENTTAVLSGASRLTRNLEMKQHEWADELFSLYPTYLRKLAFDNPNALKENQGGEEKRLTKFQASIRAAVAQATQPGFDVIREQDERRKDSQARYARQLAVKDGRLRQHTPAELQAAKRKRQEEKSSLTESKFDPLNYEIRGVKFSEFLSFLEDSRLRYTKFTSPHPCPLCDDGPTDEIVLKELLSQEVELKKENKPAPPELTQKIRKLLPKVKNWRLHQDQMATARAVVKAKLAELQVGEVGVTRDFVNHHDHSGGHVKCLHFVLQWRDEADGPLRLLKLRNYCSDTKSMSTDSYFTADAMDLHLKPGGWFDNFHTVYFFGDHGPHFSSAATMYNESTCYRRYDKEIHLLFLASYHAFGRADGAGAEDKRSAKQDLRSGFARLGAKSYTDMTNESNDPRSMAYELPQINRYVFSPPHTTHLLTLFYCLGARTSSLQRKNSSLPSTYVSGVR